MNRTNPDVQSFASLKDCVRELESQQSPAKVFIIGGSSLYTEALSMSQQPILLFLTRIYSHLDCDTFLPQDWNQPDKRLTRASDEKFRELLGPLAPLGKQSDGDYEFEFQIYERDLD
jgi:dihydrofolate reductase